MASSVPPTPHSPPHARLFPQLHLTHPPSSPRLSHLQKRHFPRLDRHIDLPLWRARLVLRNLISHRAPLVQIRVLAKSRSPEPNHLQAAATRRGRRRAHNGDPARSRLQGGAHGQRVDLGGIIAGIQRDEVGIAESVGEERRGGVEAAREGWTVDL